MKRRKLLKSVGLFSAGVSSGAVISEDISFKNDSDEPTVLFEGGEDKFELVESVSDVSQAGAMVNGNAVLKNSSSDSIIGEFKTYFIGKRDGENYGFQASNEVQTFSGSEEQEVSIETETYEDFTVREFLVVFIQER